MSRRACPLYRPGLRLDVGRHVRRHADPARPACCGVHFRSGLRFAAGFLPTRPHGKADEALPRAPTPRAVALGSRLPPTNSVEDSHLQSSAHAGHTYAPPTVHLGDKPTAALTFGLDHSSGADQRHGNCSALSRNTGLAPHLARPALPDRALVNRTPPLSGFSPSGVDPSRTSLCGQRPRALKLHSSKRGQGGRRPPSLGASSTGPAGPRPAQTCQARPVRRSGRPRTRTDPHPPALGEGQGVHVHPLVQLKGERRNDDNE